MKQTNCVYMVSLLSLSCITHTEDFKLIVKPHWHNLESNSVKTQKFGGKWILAGSITFHKKAKEQVDLTKLYLQWKGPFLDTLLASLYHKNPDKNFMPIQDNLICDGTWCKNQQTLKLTFDKIHSLRPTNTFYLVLTIPEKLESVMRNGHFEIMQQTLPHPYQTSHSGNQIVLSLDAVQATTVEVSPY